MTDQHSPQTIVFFDGICHLCNGFVDFLIQVDRKKSLRFAPLQGQTAKAFVPEKNRQNLDTVLVWHQGQVLEKSSAVIFCLRQLGLPWSLLGHFASIFPRFLRDGIYNQVAKRRLAWFGQRDFCRIPQPHERDRLLD